mmetsp:Transcript_38856/g.86839  ORF Transcript_38856/g.86839 Transcript_38856/m.86839 type:complete len:348 (-) Transcript_38856:859-1902(-)
MGGPARHRHLGRPRLLGSLRHFPRPAGATAPLPVGAGHPGPGGGPARRRPVEPGLDRPLPRARHAAALDRPGHPAPLRPPDGRHQSPPQGPLPARHGRVGRRGQRKRRRLPARLQVHVLGCHDEPRQLNVGVPALERRERHVDGERVGERVLGGVRGAALLRGRGLPGPLRPRGQKALHRLLRLNGLARAVRHPGGLRRGGHLPAGPERGHRRLRPKEGRVHVLRADQRGHGVPARGLPRRRRDPPPARRGLQLLHHLLIPGHGHTRHRRRRGGGGGNPGVRVRGLGEHGRGAARGVSAGGGLVRRGGLPARLGRQLVPVPGPLPLERAQEPVADRAGDQGAGRGGA